ncbi:MAG: hypothetical protein AAGF10_02085, partial [Verrucomicrobiota bacterium]
KRWSEAVSDPNQGEIYITLPPDPPQMRSYRNGIENEGLADIDRRIREKLHRHFKYVARLMVNRLIVGRRISRTILRAAALKIVDCLLKDYLKLTGTKKKKPNQGPYGPRN